MRVVKRERLWVDAPNILWDRKYGVFSREHWKSELFGVSWGHASDEYGNCSLYFSCALFSVVLFPGLCFQREVEVPDMGEHPFTDAMYYTKEDIEEWRQWQPQHGKTGGSPTGESTGITG
jgi:hypothetical protein